MCDNLDRITSRGYWKVIIRPTAYEEDRLTLNECRQSVTDNVVFFRGWDYPHTDRNEIEARQSSIQHETNWSHYIECWRMYQSGQFVHLFGIQEDWARETRAGGWDIEPEEWLSVLNALYQITEIFEFASRLASTQVIEDQAQISIGLHGLEGRTLFMTDAGRMLRGVYTCGEDDLSRRRQVTAQELLGRSAELALDHARWLFERFNWEHVPLDVLENDQQDLIEGRL